jgi:uncharacterized protein
MELDLDRQEHGRSEIEIRGNLDLGLGEDLCQTAAITGTLVVQNLDSRFLLNGVIRAEGTTLCGRCLREFMLQWDVPVDVMVLRDVDSDEEEGVTLLILQRRGVADLRPALRECTVLAYPQSPVCRESCQGLCATCGIDRNTESCDCSQESVDPRWEGLPD